MDRTFLLPALAVAAAAALFFAASRAQSARVALTYWDDHYTAERARMMRVAENPAQWLTVRRNFTTDHRKPPLHYWLTAATWNAFATDRAAVSWWAGVFGAGSIVLCGWWAALLIPGWRWAGPLAAGCLALSSAFLLRSSTGYLDTGMAFFLLLTAIAYERARVDPRNWGLVAGAVALGFLHKLPLGLVYVLVAWAVDRLTGGGPPPLRPALRSRTVWLAVAAALVWPCSQVAWHGWRFFDRFVMGQMVDRLAERGYHFVWSPEELGVWLLQTWPGPVLLAAAAPLLLWIRGWGGERPVFRVAVVGAVGVAAAAVSGLCLPRYILPLLPVAAVLAVWVVAGLRGHGRAVAGLLLLVSAGLGLLGAPLRRPEGGLSPQPATSAAEHSARVLASRLREGVVPAYFLGRGPLFASGSVVPYAADLRQCIQFLSPRAEGQAGVRPLDAPVGTPFLMLFHRLGSDPVAHGFEPGRVLHEEDGFVVQEMRLVDPARVRRRSP